MQRFFSTPNPPLHRGSTLKGIQTCSSVTIAPSKIILHSVNLMQRGRCFETTSHLFPLEIKKNRCQGAKQLLLSPHAVWHSLELSFLQHLVTYCEAFACHQGPSHSHNRPMVAYVICDNKPQFYMLHQQHFALQRLLLFYLTNCTPFLSLRKLIFPFCNKSSFKKPQLLTGTDYTIPVPI